MKVSVIVPIYNERRYLKDCIDSICNQTYTDLEIILVDDGSTNGAQRDCDFFATTDDRIRVIHKKNEGLSAARITGLKNATGDWIMFVDHDDLVSEFAIDRFVGEISDCEVDIVTGGRVDFDNEIPLFPDEDSMPTMSYTGREACEKLPEDQQKTIITPLWGKLYRLSFLKQLDVEQYKDECPIIFFEDILMTPILFSKARKVVVINRIMYGHREVGDSISRSGKLSEFYYDQINSGNILIDYTKQNNLKKYYKYMLGIYMLTILRIYCLLDYDTELNMEQKDLYRHKILTCYRKYCNEFIKNSDLSAIKRVMIYMFRFIPNLWKKVVYAIYFSKQR